MDEKSEGGASALSQPAEFVRGDERAGSALPLILDETHIARLDCTRQGSNLQPYDPMMLTPFAGLRSLEGSEIGLASAIAVWSNGFLMTETLITDLYAHYKNLRVERRNLYRRIRARDQIQYRPL